MSYLQKQGLSRRFGAGQEDEYEAAAVVYEE